MPDGVLQPLYGEMHPVVPDDHPHAVPLRLDRDLGMHAPVVPVFPANLIQGKRQRVENLLDGFAGRLPGKGLFNRGEQFAARRRVRGVDRPDVGLAPGLGRLQRAQQGADLEHRDCDRRPGRDGDPDPVHPRYPPAKRKEQRDGNNEERQRRQLDRAAGPSDVLVMGIEHVRKRIPGKTHARPSCRVARLADMLRAVDAHRRGDQIWRDKHDDGEEKAFQDRYARGEPHQAVDPRGIALPVVNRLYRLQGYADAVEKQREPDHEERHRRDRQRVGSPQKDDVLGGDKQQERLEKAGRCVPKAQLQRAQEFIRQEFRRETHPASSAAEKTRQEHCDAGQIGSHRAERDSAHAESRQPPLAGAETVRKHYVHDNLRTIGHRTADGASVRVDKIQQQEVDCLQKDDKRIPVQVAERISCSFGVRRHEADIESLDGEYHDANGKAEQNRCDKPLPRKVCRAFPLHPRHRVRIDDRRADRQQPGEEAHDHEYRHEHVRRAERLLAEHLPGDHAVGQHEDVLSDDHHRRGAEESDELAVGKCHATFTLSIVSAYYTIFCRGICRGRHHPRRLAPAQIDKSSPHSAASPLVRRPAQLPQRQRMNEPMQMTTT